MVTYPNDFAVVQGLGGGGIMTISNIIISDLVPLSQRGLYQGIISLTFALASGIGPPIVSLRNLPCGSCAYYLSV